ncbi:c-type cytochrome [bacterium]|nr:c-type cytochrome [bacterium]
MKFSDTIVCAVALLGIAGCSSNSVPQFETSQDTGKLFQPARDAVESELQAAFGTPENLVVWPDLPVDFGSFGGSIEKVTTQGTLVVPLAGQSALATDERLPELSGAAVLVAPAAGGEKGAEGGENAAAVYRVAHYDPESKTLRVVDENGKPTQVTAAEGDGVQVIGDGLQKGRNLYLKHCMHCHGVSGDGDGPTAPYLKPRPRDYRKGIFKFTSTKTGVRASRDDLFRLVKLGVPGTYMPSFMLLPDDEVSAIVEYVRWLSMRGELESKLVVQLALDFGSDQIGPKRTFADMSTEFDAFRGSDLPDIVKSAGEELGADWSAPEDAENLVIPKEERVASSLESIARGRKMFLSEKTKCYSCHGETGAGNGAATEEINDLPGQPGVKAEVPGLFDAWGNIVKPRNLQRGLFRGGRRPIDIYRRIHSGIKGTPMQAFGNNLSDQDIWDLVNYVLNVPFEKKTQASH